MLKLLAELPLPNLPGNDLNWQGSSIEKVDYWNWSNRVDWNINEKWKAFVRYGHMKTTLLENAPDDAKGKLFPTSGSNRNGISVAADTVYTINSRMVLNLRANYHRLTDEYANEPNQLGLQGLQNLWPNNPWYTSLLTRETVYYRGVDVGASNRLGRRSRE